MELTKTEQREGRCYGVAYNPETHAVTICYRDVDNVVIEKVTIEE